MLSMSRAEIQSLYKRAQSAQTRVKRAREAADEIVGTVVQTTECTGMAFAMGMVNGRYGGVEVMGVPLDLLVGAGGHVLGFLGVGDEHLHNLADGSLCCYTATLGSGIGREMAVKAAAGGAAAQGIGPGRSPGLSDQQLRDIAAGAARG